MNTTAAAIQANVTAATIRSWCRRGVITAVKQAGRWIINTASLTHRITIGARRMSTPSLDLTATYTVHFPGTREPVTITPTVKRRTSRATGENLIVITGLAPLLADKIDAIADESTRLHTLTLLEGARIVLSDQENEAWAMNNITARHNGRIRTTYNGTRHLPAAVVLDLGEQLAAIL